MLQRGSWGEHGDRLLWRETGGAGCLQRHVWRLCRVLVETHRNTDIGEREIPGVRFEERAPHRIDRTAEKGMKVTATGGHSPAPWSHITLL